MYLLDTDVISAARKLPPEHRLVTWLQRNNTILFLSVVTAMEIERGIEKQRHVDPPFATSLELWLHISLTAFGDRVLPITIPIARHWGRLQSQLGRADNDLPIAATALEYGFQFVTRNVKHFKDTGVSIVNPFEQA